MLLKVLVLVSIASLVISFTDSAATTAKPARATTKAAVTKATTKAAKATTAAAKTTTKATTTKASTTKATAKTIAAKGATTKATTKVTTTKPTTAAPAIKADPLSTLRVSKDLTTQKFQDECLKSHNDYRKLHNNTLPLSTNQDLVAFATTRAKKLADSGSVKKDLNSGHGENIHNQKGEVGCYFAVKYWYDEKKLFDWDDPNGFNGMNMRKVEGFVQVVSRASTNVGCGQALSKYGTFTVCEYDPDGTQVGENENNVQPLIGSKRKAGAGGKKKKRSHVPKKIAVTKDWTTKAFQEECVKSHNDFRKLHDAPPLTTSDKLVKVAMGRAQTLASNSVMDKDPNSDYGENLHKKYTSGGNVNFPCFQITKAWYNQIRAFNYSNPNGFKAVGGSRLNAASPFIQVVTLRSTTLGCGQSSSEYGTFSVCNYEPDGTLRDGNEKFVKPLKNP